MEGLVIFDEGFCGTVLAPFIVRFVVDEEEEDAVDDGLTDGLL